MKVNVKNLIFFIAMILSFVLIATFFTANMNEEKPILWSDVQAMFEENRVTEFTVTPNSLLKLKGFDEQGKTVEYSFQLSLSAQYNYLNEVATASKTDPDSKLEKYNFEAPQETPWILNYLPYILLIGVIIFIVVMMSRASNGGGMGKMNSFSRAKTRTPDPANAVTFADVAGADEEKEELREVVEFLRDPGKFTALGARIPRGILLVGPPGTGKTLLAKAVAGEANVPFFSISGSDFVEMYVGVGASRVRDLFDNARKTPAAIIFIDEIDAVGRRRGTGLGGGHDEREQTLNQLLVEMDGFGTHQGIIVMAATNRPDVLDPALLRPGRFDRQVTVGYPDIKGREEILKVHAKGKRFEKTVDFHHVAQTTIGFTGADLSNLLNEAAILAARREKSLIGPQDIEDSYMKILLGTRKKSAARTERDNRLVAYHEAGHAVASFYAPKADPVKQITILPAGNTGGVTVRVPGEDSLGRTKNQMLDDIVVALGGRVAEELVLGDISTGASSDIQHATQIATDMVTRYGMSERLGTILYGSEHSRDEVFLGRDFNSSQSHSEKTAAAIDEEIKRFIDECYQRCTAYLAEHREKLELVANYLLRNETMEGDTFEAAMKGEGITLEDLEAIDENRRRESEEENRVAAEEKKAEEEEKTEAEREMLRALGLLDEEKKEEAPKADDDLFRM